MRTPLPALVLLICLGAAGCGGDRHHAKAHPARKHQEPVSYCVQTNGGETCTTVLRDR